MIHLVYRVSISFEMNQILMDLLIEQLQLSFVQDLLQVLLFVFRLMVKLILGSNLRAIFHHHCFVCPRIVEIFKQKTQKFWLKAEILSRSQMS